MAKMRAPEEYTGKEGVYRWSESFGRMGSLDGVFTAKADEVADVVGRDVHFGEVLGKHSDVSCELEEGQFALLTDDADFVEKFKAFRLGTGTDPIQKLRDREEDESDEEEDEE